MTDYVALVFGLYLFGSLFFVNLLTNKLFQKEIKIILGYNVDTSSLGEQRTTNIGRDRISHAAQNASNGGVVNFRRGRFLSLFGPGIFQGRVRSQVANQLTHKSTNNSIVPRLIIEQTNV